MCYDEFKQYCRKTWEEEYKHLLIDRSKKRDQGDSVSVMKSKTHTLKVLLKQILSSSCSLKSVQIHSVSFSEVINRVIFSTKHKDDLKDPKELEDLQSNRKQIRLFEKLGEQGF